MKNFFNEFKKFISRGNVIDLAVGVIIGSAFTAIVVFCMVKAINTVQDKMTKKPEKEETPAEPTTKTCPFCPVSYTHLAIKRLHDEGFRLEVASSSAGYYIGRVLDALEIRQYFECYTSGEEVEHPKPAPDTFLRAMEKLNLKPEDCIIVEDSTNGGKAAAAAGAKCVWFHNPDSGDQQIPHAVLTITSWSPENVDKLIDLMHA